MVHVPHHDFSRRLHRALDYAGFVVGRPRTSTLADEYDVSRETSRKWLSGLALPELHRMIDLAVRCQVSFEWRATGRGNLKSSMAAVAETRAAYGDQEELRLLGIVRKLPRKKRQALIALLDDPGARSR